MGAKKRVLVSCHSKDLSLASKIMDSLSVKRYDQVLMTEERPVQCRLREQAVQWAGVVVILMSSKYQHNKSCMQVAHDAKDCRQPITAVLVQPNYNPTGALGILSFAGGDRIDFSEVSNAEFEQAMELLTQDIRAKQPKQNPDVPKPSNDLGFRSKFGDLPKSGGSDVFISYHHDQGAKEVAELVQNGRGISQSLSKVKITLANQAKDNTAAIKKCKAFIAIVTPGYQESTKCENEFECARAAAKMIIPVKCDHRFRPHGWLAIGIAGMLCHEIHDNVQAYTANPYVPNTNPMNDLVEAILAPIPPSQEESDAVEIAVLRKESEKFKSKLWQWPPKKRPPFELREMPVLGWDDLVPSEYYEDNSSGDAPFHPPKPLVDILGRPLDQEFDVMLSYQRDIRPFVQDVYKDLEKRGFKPWMAFTGMRGDLYTAMATAIEQSHVFVAFLTDKYQQGLNLALPYALSRNKPVIFIKAQPDLELKEWIKEAMSERLVFQMSSITSARITDYGVSRMDRFSEAIRLLSKWEKEKENVRDDVSEEVFREREQLKNAQYWSNQDSNQNQFANHLYRNPSPYEVETNRNRYGNDGDRTPTNEKSRSGSGMNGHHSPNQQEINVHLETPPQSYNSDAGSNVKNCTRCGGKYVGYSRYGCKKHSKYFREGSIIIGKWMCCDKRGRKAPGCTASSHTVAERQWVQQSKFEGTECYNWVPE